MDLEATCTPHFPFFLFSFPNSTSPRSTFVSGMKGNGERTKLSYPCISHHAPVTGSVPDANSAEALHKLNCGEDKLLRTFPPGRQSAAPLQRCCPLISQYRSKAGHIYARIQHGPASPSADGYPGPWLTSNATEELGGEGKGSRKRRLMDRWDGTRERRTLWEGTSCEGKFREIGEVFCFK